MCDPQYVVQFAASVKTVT